MVSGKPENNHTGRAARRIIEFAHQDDGPSLSEHVVVTYSACVSRSLGQGLAHDPQLAKGHQNRTCSCSANLDVPPFS